MALLAPLPFVESLTGRFVYDDHLLIEEPASVHSLGHLAELWRDEFWRVLPTIHFHYFRPLVSTSYAVDWTVFGGQPFGFHLTNLALHAAVAATLYWTLCRWIAPPLGPNERAPATRVSQLGALLVSLAWAWHPSKVEAVAWIAGRTDLLCALGILIACAGVNKRLAGASRAGLALEAVGLFVALTSKEHGIVAPAFAAAEAWVFLRGRVDPSRLRDELRDVLVVIAPQIAVVAAYLTFRFVKYPIVPAGTGTLSFLDARLYTVETFGEFARVVFFPFPLTIQHAPIRVDAAFRVIHESSRLAAGFGLAALLAVAVIAWKRRGAGWRIAGVALGLAALAPVANVTAAKMVFLFAERFAYLPLMGFAWSLVPTGAPSLRTKATWGALAVACAALSARHTRDFLDDRHLWEHELAENPEQPLALRFACQDAMNRRQFRDALELAQRGYEASAGWPVPQPDRVEFALRSARSLEAMTLDADVDTLAQIAGFYDVFFANAGTARLDVRTTHVAVEAAGTEARNFRRRDPSRLAQVALWRAIANSRLSRCEGLVEGALALDKKLLTQSDHIALALSLGRCGREDDALAVVQALGSSEPPVLQLAQNLRWIKGQRLENRGGDEDSALRWSRARTMLFDRGGALRALLPFRATIVADPEGLIFFARTAWAAGEDALARETLSAREGAEETEARLAAWSKELDRAP